MHYFTPQLFFSLDEAGDFPGSAARQLGIPKSAILDWKFHKRSLDVRQKRPKYQAILDIEISPRDKMLAFQLEKKGCTVAAPDFRLPSFAKRTSPPHIAIVGAGPSGLFAAMTFAEAGFKVEIFERGKMVSERTRDVAGLMHNAVLNPESNICFGEGGAGTYSDGKLMTRTKSKYIPHILQRFVQFGADSSILYEAHPHIGTDRLTPILVEMRKWLESRGIRYHFGQRVDDFKIESGRCRGIIVNGDFHPADAVFLCIGHSADDTFNSLLHHGVAMEPKPLAVGVRVEHPQALINQIQYGRYANHPLLPPAEYAVRFNDDKMPSVFSFCMCPGGRVVASQTSENTRVVNGMSGSHRNGRFANAALVVQVTPDMFPSGPLGGLQWIRTLERKAAMNCPPAFAPAQSMTDFIAHKTPSVSPKTTYSPGTHPSNLHAVLPKKICIALEAALPVFNRQMHGFITQDASFIGVESRTSSPVRILRNDKYQAVDIEGLYPLGEGAGYAGGITSCALDGISAAIACIQK